MIKDEFIIRLKELGISITEEQLLKLEKYYELLIEKNKVMNLTTITEKEEVYLKHFYDSLTIVKSININEINSICDIGTGAGFPGLVLKILFPKIKITLVDALEKRIKFLNEVIEKLDLKDINAVHDRIELYSKQNKEKYDLVVSRAVSTTNILLELGAQLVKINGYYIFMKGEAQQELKESKKAINTLGFTIYNINKFYLPNENSKRTLICLRKISKTNTKYPREFGKIKKMPL